MFFCSLSVYWDRKSTRSQQNSEKDIITWDEKLWHSGAIQNQCPRSGEICHDPFVGYTLETSLAVPMLQGEEPGARSGVASFPSPGLWTKNLSINWEEPAAFRNNLLMKDVSEVKHLRLLICHNSVSKFIQPFPLTGLYTCLQFVIHLTKTSCEQAVLIGFLSSMEAMTLLLQLWLCSSL